MSDPDSKAKKSKRLQKTHNAIAKQLKIAKTVFPHDHNVVEQPHRLAKHHALDCGKPECLVCHSEKVFHKPTFQERKANEKFKKDTQNN